MSGDRAGWLDRIRDVERDHEAIRIAADRLLDAARADPNSLPASIPMAGLSRARGRLEETYLIRLFAEFE